MKKKTFKRYMNTFLMTRYINSLFKKEKQVNEKTVFGKMKRKSWDEGWILKNKEK
jgi:hypothetical protein